MLSNQPSHKFPPDMPQVSILVPAFNEESNLRRLYVGLMNVLPSLDMPWEIIFSDDGSTDRTWDEITSLHKEDDRVKGVRLSRNFGHQHALLAGLFHATGEAIITMDSDLQHPPEVIPKLVAEWRKGNYNYSELYRQ